MSKTQQKGEFGSWNFVYVINSIYLFNKIRAGAFQVHSRNKAFRYHIKETFSFPFYKCMSLLQTKQLKLSSAASCGSYIVIYNKQLIYGIFE